MEAEIKALFREAEGNWQTGFNKTGSSINVSNKNTTQEQAKKQSSAVRR